MKRLARSLLLLAALMSAPPSLAQDSDALRSALSGPDRDVNDYVRDAVRRPVEVLEFLGIGPGMTVLDVYAAGGYYTFILAKAVGPDGTVYAQNTPRGLNFEEDRQDMTQGEALENKIRRGNLVNVVHLVRRLQEIDLPANSLDAVIVAQVLHDYYNPSPARAQAMLEQFYSLLKPGGVIGVMDHVGLTGNDNRALHRMRIEDAVAVAEAAGFRVESSDLLRNPNDIHARSIFDPRLNRNTDRFLLKLTRPE